MMKKIRSVIVLVALLLQAAPALALTKKVGEKTVVDKRHYPVIFIHGAAGAELDGAGGNYWPGTLWPTDSAFDILALAPDGKRAASGPGVWPTRVMRYGGGWEVDWFPDLTFASVYNGFYDYMGKQGYPYETVGDDGKVFYDFVYDWRMDNRRWTADLDKKVEAVLKATGAEKVILMGHSMGGLQIRLYMKDAKRAKKVGGIVFMGTPQNGAPQVFVAYTEGYNFGNKKVSARKMWEIMKNWQAGYQLLPDWQSVRDKETGRVWTLDEMYGDGFISSQEYAHYQAAQAAGQPYTVTYGLPSVNFRRDAVQFHRELGSSVAKYDGKYWLIRGDKVRTLQALNATLTPVPGLDKPLLKLERVETKEGDGTVPTRGASIAGVDEEIVVDGVEHGDIPSDGATHPHLTRIRKEINDEDFRNELVEDVKRYAPSKLDNLRARRQALDEADEDGDGEKGLMRIFLGFLFGQKDEKKVKARDELIDYAARTFQNADVNIHFPADGLHDEDTIYLSIKGFQVQDAGTGAFEKPYVTVEMESYQAFDEIMGGSDLRQAMRNGKFDLVGGGFVSKFKFKALQWINKYVK
jgi:pimeloyl-ACP methyl ester carboxylesterase